MSIPEPKLEIHGRIFVVDVKYAELRQQDRPLNVIPFHEMENKASHYELSFDKENGTLGGIDSLQNDLMTVRIPLMVELDPEGVAEKYSIPINALPPRDTELSTNPAVLNDRLNGKLPRLLIGDQMYLVHERRMQLDAIDDPFKTIRLGELYQGEAGSYFALYDDKRHEIVPWDNEKTVCLPENTKMLIIPNQIWLDPISVIEFCELDEKEFLSRYPVQAVHKAKLYPLSVTGFPQKMKENKQRLDNLQSKPKIRHNRRLRL